MLVPFALGSTISLAAQAPDDLTRAGTLNLLSATNQLISTAVKKTAFVFYGLPATATCAEPDSITVAIDGPPDSSFGVALAVAIHTNGYFLTAAHIAENPALTLVFHDTDHLRAAPARVVARVSRSSKTGQALDIALLHVANTQLSNVFTWAEIDSTRRHNSIAVQIGAAAARHMTKTNALLQIAAFAGRVKRFSQLPTGGATLQTDLPARLGDSGGPLLNKEGRLLAIHSSHRLSKPLFGSVSGLATRPDLTWLRDAISSDQQSLSLPTASRLQTFGEPIYITVRLLPVAALPR